ncbi:MAG: hypothetical protein AAF916_06430 [Planctomycetota bacterium]
MSRCLWVLVGSMALATIGCQAGPRTTIAPDFDAGVVATYAWDPAGNLEMGVVPQNAAAIDVAVVTGVEAHVQSLGRVEATDRDADVWLSYFVAAGDREQVTKTGTLTIAGETTVVPVETVRFRDGRLVIQVLEPLTREILWEAEGTRSREGVPSRESVGPAVSKAVQRLMRGLR